MFKILQTLIVFISVFLFQNIKAQVVNDSILVDNHYRTFHFKKPNLQLQNSSLIFVLHGSGNNGINMMKATSKLIEIADNENLIAVFPDAYFQNWNDCRKMAPAVANSENIDENTFFSKMILYFEQKYRINLTKVFVVGTSGGGHMAFKLAMTMPEKFAGISAIIANIPAPINMDCTQKKMPIPVLIINGTNDSVNPYNGGISATNKGLVFSTNETFQYWAKLNGHQGKPKFSTLPNVDLTDEKTIEKYSYTQKNKPEVTLLKVINGEHNYPKDIDVHVESWHFFKRQSHKN